jgi:hypothetical protein
MKATQFSLSLGLVVMFGVASISYAADPRANVPPPPPAPQAPEINPDDPMEPEITITTRNGERHEEYRMNGRLYMVKVTPRRGPPYYLVFDEQGRSRRSDLEPDIVPPSWVIKRF